jgi:hypothetical protein
MGLDGVEPSPSTNYYQECYRAIFGARRTIDPWNSDFRSHLEECLVVSPKGMKLATPETAVRAKSKGQNQRHNSQTSQMRLNERQT